MLKRLLHEAARGGVGSTRELSEALGVSESMIEAMMQELARRGLVEQASECRPGCEDCPVGPVCAGHGFGVWVLTDAGRRAASH
ncbi:MAG: FeoC-like transcriptional regulator [Gammaproteobacteria bacterium]